MDGTEDEAWTPWMHVISHCPMDAHCADATRDRCADEVFVPLMPPGWYGLPSAR